MGSALAVAEPRKAGGCPGTKGVSGRPLSSRSRSWRQLGLLTGSQMLGETCQQFCLLAVLVYKELGLLSTGTGVGWGY